MKLQGNGEATKSEIKVAKVRNKRGGWSQGIIKSSAKKRKAETENESLLNNVSSIATRIKSHENGIDDDVQQASSSDGPPVLTVDPTLDDSQASDAFDSQPEIDSAPPLIVSEKSVVVVNVKELEELLNTIVAKTEDWSLEKLLRLYSKLSKLIDRYLKLWDRQSMIEV
jgi:hypothetical protein